MNTDRNAISPGWQPASVLQCSSVQSVVQRGFSPIANCSFFQSNWRLYSAFQNVEDRIKTMVWCARVARLAGGFSMPAGSALYAGCRGRVCTAYFVAYRLAFGRLRDFPEPVFTPAGNAGILAECHLQCLSQ